MSRFAQKVVIVTGAARGIGLAIAERFAAEEARVVIADRDEDGGARAAEEIASIGGETEFVSCDVSERLDIMNLMAAVQETFGRVDILINNAGVSDEADFLTLDVDEFSRVLNVNLVGAFVVASINAHFALENRVAYSVSKGGLVSLTKAMALALAKHNIRVNAIAPGTIMTPMVAQIAKDEELRREVLSRTPLGRIGQPNEIAGVAAFLASDDASYMTGETLFVDGGRMPLNRIVPIAD